MATMTALYATTQTQTLLAFLRQQYDTLAPGYPFELYLVNQMRKLGATVYDSPYRYRLSDEQRLAIIALVNS